MKPAERGPVERERLVLRGCQSVGQFGRGRGRVNGWNRTGSPGSREGGDENEDRDSRKQAWGDRMAHTGELKLGRKLAKDVRTRGGRKTRTMAGKIGSKGACTWR